MFKIIKGDIDNLQHVYENGRGTNHYIKITNDISSFNFMQGTVANDLSSSAVKVAQIGDNVIELQDKCFYNCTALSGVNSSTNLKQLG